MNPTALRVRAFSYASCPLLKYRICYRENRVCFILGAQKDSRYSGEAFRGCCGGNEVNQNTSGVCMMSKERIGNISGTT